MKKKLIHKLIEAVIDNDPVKVNRLLNLGVDPNACLDDALISPLHFAAQYGALDVIPLLIAAGARLEAMTYPDDYTALDIALLHDHYDLANLFLMYLRLSPTLH